jgi:hypothetical protein
MRDVQCERQCETFKCESFCGCVELLCEELHLCTSSVRGDSEVDSAPDVQCETFSANVTFSARRSVGAWSFCARSFNCAQVQCGKIQKLIQRETFSATVQKLIRRETFNVRRSKGQYGTIQYQTFGVHT